MLQVFAFFFITMHEDHNYNSQIAYSY